MRSPSETAIEATRVTIVPEPTKKLLVLKRPPRPWSQMTEAEKQAFARETVQLAESRIDEPQRPSKLNGRRS